MFFFFTHSFNKHLLVVSQVRRLGSPVADTEVEFQERSVHEGLRSVKAGGGGRGVGSRTGPREMANCYTRQAGGRSGEDACWTCPGATFGQYGCVFMPLLVHSLDEGCPGEGMTKAR